MSQAPAAEFRALPVVPGISPSLFLSVLGITGITAWVGLTQIANIKEGDTGIQNSSNIVTRGLTVKGFTMGSYFHLAPRFAEAMQGWLAEGKIAYDETITDGIDNAFEAFTGMMNGANVGKAIVRL